MKVAVVFIGLLEIFSYGDANAGTFHWSKSYTLKAILTVPAANITEPYQVWLDGDTGRSRVDFYHGMDKLYREYDINSQAYKYFKIHPVTNVNMESKEVCTEVNANAPEVKMYALNTYLPVKHWAFVGNELLNNVEAKKFIYKYPVKINQKGTGEVVYTVWVNINGAAVVPVRFVYELRGETKLLDNYRHDYTYFDGSKPDASILEKPSDIICRPYSVESYLPIDPLVEYIESDLEYSRMEQAFEWFKTKHNKIYTNEYEHFKRMNIFKNNLRFINSFNRQHRSITVGVNHLADLSKEEILYGILNEETNSEKPMLKHFNNKGSGEYDIGSSESDVFGGEYDDIDEDDDDMDLENLSGIQANFDWRDYGAVTPVKDQTTICGSCYAFTTAAAIESSAYVARGCKYLEEVSEQSIIDCTWGVGNGRNTGNIGCSGGLYENALRWVKKYGIPLKSEYGPYLAMEGRCHATQMNKLIRIGGYTHLDKKKKTIKDSLRENGPLLASIDASPLSFTFYTGGLYKEPTCSNDPTKRSHGVTIVGYGRENNEDYWIIKNSFGRDWGEDGYMRLAQASNRCGLKNFVYSVNYEKNMSYNCNIKS